ncbi:hypothetical protein BGAL_0262g00070 [Botrytis galanthina]|uniref:Uncharacterized protein n=1 Tax=Botrytis galanthina TaxID=278940 RepID=A0A4S8R4T7_9HELO|nr:hypothetical protein BGAL_0262g00070 [Botrytis galanthina]
MTAIKKEFETPYKARKFLDLLGFILYQHFFSYLISSKAMYTIPSWYADHAQAVAWIERFLIMESGTTREDARSKAMQFAGAGRLLYAKSLDSWTRFLGDEDMAADIYYALQSIIVDPKKREKAHVPELISVRITEDRVILLRSQVERLVSMIPKELSLFQKFHLMLLLSLMVSIPLTIDILLNKYCYTGEGTFSNLWFFTIPTTLAIVLACAWNTLDYSLTTL